MKYKEKKVYLNKYGTLFCYLLGMNNNWYYYISDFHIRKLNLPDDREFDQSHKIKNNETEGIEIEYEY